MLAEGPIGARAPPATRPKASYGKKLAEKLVANLGVIRDSKLLGSYQPPWRYKASHGWKTRTEKLCNSCFVPNLMMVASNPLARKP